MSLEITKFIEDNIDLIDINTKESWEEAFSECNLLNSINYLGTKAQAMQLLRQSNVCWDEDSLIRHLVCSDGKINV